MLLGDSEGSDDPVTDIDGDGLEDADADPDTVMPDTVA